MSRGARMSRGAGPRTRPVRLAEFDGLFATAVRRVDLVSTTHTRLHLIGSAGLAARVRDLAARKVSAGPEQNAAYGEPALFPCCEHHHPYL